MASHSNVFIYIANDETSAQEDLERLQKQFPDIADDVRELSRNGSSAIVVLKSLIDRGIFTQIIEEGGWNDYDFGEEERFGRALAEESEPTISRISHFLGLVTENRSTFSATRRVDSRMSAPDFNVFEFIRPGELRLSQILAFFLNPAGEHGQGRMFLSEFLDELRLDWPAAELDAARVEVEVSTIERRRVDIVIRLPNAIIGIENKPFAADQPNQVEDYLTWLDFAGKEGRRCLIYLVGAEGVLPTEGSIKAESLQARYADGQFLAISYQSLIPWLTRAEKLCEAGNVASFVKDFICYIQSAFMGVKNMSERTQLLDLVSQSPENLRSALQLISAGSDIKGAVIKELERTIRAQLPSGYILSWFDISRDNYTGLRIIMPDINDLQFSISFEGKNYSWLIYGVSKIDDAEPSVDSKTLLDAKFGRGTVTKAWPWYRRASPSELFFNAQGDWREDEKPWLEALDGTFSATVVTAAQKFRETLMLHSKP